MPDKEQISELIKEKLAEIVGEQIKSDELFSDEKRVNAAKKIDTIYRIFLECHEFKEGQFIEWKQGLKNRIRPYLREPAVVIKLLKSPEFDTEKDSGTPYFKEPLDMIIGVLEENQENLLFFHVDKRRFKPFEG